MALTIRLLKGSALTHQELDDNFTFLSSSIVSSSSTGLTLSGSFAAERVIISGNTSSAAPGGLATTENIRVWVDNGGFAIGGSQGLNGVQGVGLVISETPSNGNHVILSDGSGSNLNLRAGGGNVGNRYVVVLADQAGTQESDVFEIAKFGGPFRGTELYHTGSLVFNTAEIGANKAIVVTGTISASAEVYLSGLSNTSVPNIVGFNTATGKLSYYSTASFGGGGTDITSLNSFTGSANTRLNNLEAATGSYLTGADTGSFLYSGSYNSAASAITLYSKSTNYTLDLSGLAGGGGGGFPITASNEGSDLTNSMSKIDFVGNAVTATSVGSIVTVTINTGSATAATDITALNSFSGSAQTSINGLNSFSGSAQTSINGLNTFSGSAQTSINGLNTFSGSAQTSINGLNTFSGSANTRLDSLEAATGSYVTNAKTGSFYYSSSINNNTITFTQGDGTTEQVIVNNVASASFATSASFAPNFYNSDGTTTGVRLVTLPQNLVFANDEKFIVSGSGGIFFNGINELNPGYVLTYNPGGGAPGLITFASSSNLTVASASYALTASYQSNAFIQGGNTFGTQAVLGTNDSNNLVFETNNLERASITDSGSFIVGTGAGALNTILNSTATTTNATPATLLTLATTTGYIYTVHAYVAGASTANAVGGEVIRTFKNISGTLTAAGSAVANVIEDFAGSPTFTLTTSGSYVILQVTGVATTEINWAGSLRFVTIAAPSGGE